MTAADFRVSSPKRQKIDSQRAELEAWAKRQRLKRVEWHEDRETGKHLDRPAFQRLQAAIFAGSVDTVIVWKLDRLARDLKDGINVLADWCQRGTRVVSVTQQIDLSGPVGQMIAGPLLGVAAIELQHSKERQAIGIADAQKRGVYTGRKAGTTKAQPARARALRRRFYRLDVRSDLFGQWCVIRERGRIGNRVGSAPSPSFPRKLPPSRSISSAARRSAGDTA